MARSVSATQAKLKFGEILADVSFGKNHVMVEKQGKQLAVIIPLEAYEEYLKFKHEEKRYSRQELWQRINEFRESLPPPPPDAPDAVQILREIRHRDRFS